MNELTIEYFNYNKSAKYNYMVIFFKEGKPNLRKECAGYEIKTALPNKLPSIKNKKYIYIYKLFIV